MITVRQLVARSLRRIGYLDGTSAPMAHEMEQGVDGLNEIYMSWQREGLSLPDKNFTVNDTLEPSGYDNEFVALLAIRLTDDFSPEVETTQLKLAATRAYESLERAFLPRSGRNGYRGVGRRTRQPPGEDDQ